MLQSLVEAIHSWHLLVTRSVSEAADRPYSYVLVTTKAVPERITTSAMLKPLLSSPYADTRPQPTYVLLQNGLNVELDLYHTLKVLDKGDPSIISAAVYINTNLVEPNVVEHNHIVSVLSPLFL
jgi:2-dehydropantoate 2-reductase